MKKFTTFLFVSLLFIPSLVLAEEISKTPIDKLIQELKTKPDLKVEKIMTLPNEIQGPIDIIGEFDTEKNKWEYFSNSERYGEINSRLIIFLDYSFGNDGFVHIDYVKITDRKVVTYTGINNERKIVLSIMDDAAFKDGLILNLNIGPKKIRYLVRRIR